MSALEALLDSLPKTALVVGKGGVGKTTCAAGIASALATRGQKTLLVSTDPAAALGSVLGEAVTTSAMPLTEHPLLLVRQLAASELRKDFLDRWRDVLVDIIDRGTYLDRAEIDGIVDAALPGADEIFALLALADLIAESSDVQRIVVDTAPTGHTLRLLALPDTFSALVSMLDLMQDKHRFMVQTLMRRYRTDRADEFLDEMRGRIDRLRAALCDEHAVAAVVVTRDEPVVHAETERYIERLRELHVRVAAVVVNAVRSSTVSVRYDVPTFTVAAQSELPVGLPRIDRLLSTLRAASSRAVAAKPKVRATRRAPEQPTHVDVASLVRTLTIVGGKGGVGKSTVACALAIAAVDADQERTLLVSTDPAPSLADALDRRVGSWNDDHEEALAEVPGLVMRQMDATSAFNRLRDEYQARIDGLFSALVGRGVGVDLERDRAIVRDLLALAPPGIDELYALSILGDALDEGRFARIVVDPAPTGHLLRLLDMPAMALDWTHRLMRLMLEYREVVGLGEAARELLNFAKRTRTLDALLHDRQRSSLTIVALDEPVVRAETERLIHEVERRRIEVGAVIWNRASVAPAPLPGDTTVRQFFASEVVPSPVGVDAIRRWSATWSTN